MVSPLSLGDAQKLVRQHSVLTGEEQLTLQDALGRISSSSLAARHALPTYRQSLYDGFVVPRQSGKENKTSFYYEIKGEIAAGCTKPRICRAGECFRIMTGAAIPRGGWKVIQQEHCVSNVDMVEVAKETVIKSHCNYRKIGDDWRKGARIVLQGELLTPAHIGHLADTGHDMVDIRKRVRTAYCCTGSELVSTSAASGFGLKVSSNRFLLNGLIRANGGEALDWGSVSDDPDLLSKQLEKILQHGADIIITTGGMGPGKYDLVEQVFNGLGGRVVFKSLRLRPGKAVLFGQFGRSLFFGLPGPPSAVKALFQALIRQALLQMQGCRRGVAEKKYALLLQDMQLRRSKVPRLLEGISATRKNGCYVRLAQPKETGDCYMVLPANRKALFCGSTITILPTAPPPGISQGNSHLFWQAGQK